MQGQTYNLQSIAVGRIVQRPENEDKQKFQYYSGVTIKSALHPHPNPLPVFRQWT